MNKGALPVTNRAASPDAGGWSAVCVIPLHAGQNTVRLEHKSLFPYYEKLAVAPVPAGMPVTKTNIQVSRQYGINPGFLDHWVEEMNRAKGAPHSVLFAWYAFDKQGSLDDKSLQAWTSPAAKLFQGFRPKSREELAALYQQHFQQASTEWQALQATLPPDANEADSDLDDAPKKEVKQPTLADASLDPLREQL